MSYVCNVVNGAGQWRCWVIARPYCEYHCVFTDCTHVTSLFIL